MLQSEKDLRLAMLTTAKSMVRLAVREHGGSNKGEIVSRLLELQNGHDGDPWCAAFYSFCYEFGHDMVGLPRGYDPGLSTSEIVRNGKAADKITYEPRGGDAVCFKVKPGDADTYHTGFKHTAMFGGWVDRSMGVYHTIEGNIGDAVVTREHNVKTDPVVFVSCF